MSILQNNLIRTHFLILVAYLFLASNVLSAENDEESSDAILNASGVYVLPEIFVISSKKTESEKAQDVPAAISVYTGETIEENFARDLTDVGEPAPNVKLYDLATFPNTAMFYIRGMGVTSSIPSDEPAVGIFVDGMYLGMNIGSLIDMFDVETVEVMRGPQGTLFGRNVTGGAVLVRHRRPTGEFNIRGQSTAGTQHLVEQKLVVEGPLTDSLAGKLGVVYRDKDGYFDNLVVPGDDIGDGTTALLRPMLTWKPTQDLEITVIGEFSKFDGDGVAVRLLEDKVFSTPPPSSDRDLMTDLMPDNDYHYEQVVVDINWDIGPGKLTSISGWRQITLNEEVDADGTGNSIFHIHDTRVEQDQFSEELRYAVAPNDRMQLTTGLSFFTQNITLESVRDILGGTIQTAMRSKMDHNAALGIFSQAEIDVFETLTLTLGGRYTYEDKKAYVASFGGDVSLDLNSYTYDFVDDDNWNFISGHAGLSWRASEHALLYSSWTRSFRSGGYNLRNALPASPGPYDEEKVNAFEIGLKADWLEGRLRTNLAGFYNIYSDLQRTVLTPLLTQEKLNAADATIAGFEAELSFMPTQYLQLDASLGYVDAEYDEYEGLDVDGDGIPDPDLAEDLDFAFVPEWTAYLGGVCHVPLPWRLGGNLELRASASYTDRYALTEKNQLFQGSYTLVNASASYVSPNEKFKFSVFGRNLLDKHYSNFGASSSLFDMEYAQPGATGGIALSFEF
ncbi:MAG: TonB-dependent receptor [Planctomycetota bacterium]|jgi:outer membrane receptor protein involved in Fe transport